MTFIRRITEKSWTLLPGLGGGMTKIYKIQNSKEWLDCEWLLTPSFSAESRATRWSEMELGLPHGEVLFHPQLESLQSFYQRATRMQKVYIILDNRLKQKSPGLQHRQTSPGSGNPLSWKSRLKEEIIMYARPALTLVFLGAVLGAEHWAIGDPGIWITLDIFASSPVTQMDSRWNILLIIGAEITLTISLWELLCLLKGPGTALGRSHPS